MNCSFICSLNCRKDCCGVVLRTNVEKTFDAILGIADNAATGRGQVLKLEFYEQGLKQAATSEDRTTTIALIEKMLDPAQDLFTSVEKVSTSLSRSDEFFTLLIHDLFSCPCIELTVLQKADFIDKTQTLVNDYTAVRKMINKDFINGIIAIQNNIRNISIALYQTSIDWIAIQASVVDIQKLINKYLIDEPNFKTLYQKYQDDFFEFFRVLSRNQLMNPCKPDRK